MKAALSLEPTFLSLRSVQHTTMKKKSKKHHWLLYNVIDHHYFLSHEKETRERKRGWQEVLLVLRQVWGWPFGRPATRATKVSLDVLWKSEERRNEEEGENGSRVGGGLNWFPLWWQLQSGWHQGPPPPPPPFHDPHPSVRSLHPCASVALGKWPPVVSCSWRVRSTSPLHLSFHCNCLGIVAADRFSDKSIIFGTKVTLSFFFFYIVIFFFLQ